VANSKLFLFRSPDPTTNSEIVNLDILQIV